MDLKAVKRRGKKPETISLPGPYCGVSCIFAAVKLHGKSLVYQDVLKPAYISSSMGSSLLALEKAATDFGLHAHIVGNLTIDVLRHSPHLIVLHTKRDELSKDYDHFELFIGDRNGSARILDLPKEEMKIPYYQLASRWDGMGLVVSDQSMDLDALFSIERERFILFAGFGVLLVFTLQRIGSQRRRNLVQPTKKQKVRGSIIEAGGLIVFSAALGIGYHWLSGEGFLSHADATAGVIRANIGSFLDIIKVDEIPRIDMNETVFVDARFPGDFQKEHLENALNVPVFYEAKERKEALKDIGKDKRIIVYCQSQGCGYAERVALGLLDDGRKNIALFRGGWQEWRKRHDAVSK
ncbi:MAG: rhodanese-like domain-containing protein [Planctomycetota bacterium]